MNSLSEIIPPDDCKIKSEVQDIEAKARNTGAAGLTPELPLAPGSPLLPGARGLFARASNKRAEEGRTQICRAQQAFLFLASALPKAASRVESAPGTGVALTPCVTPAKPQLTALSQLKYLKTYCTFNPQNKSLSVLYMMLLYLKQ